MLIELLLLTAAPDAPEVIATFHHPLAARENLVAEQIERPTSRAPDVFSEALVEAEGLTSWGAMDPTRSEPGGVLQWRARHAGDGKEVIVYFAPGKPLVCRITRDGGGASEARYQATRWCAAALGIQLPVKPSPPIVSGALPPRN